MAIKDGLSFNRDAGENNVIVNQGQVPNFTVQGRSIKNFLTLTLCLFLFQPVNKILRIQLIQQLCLIPVENIGVEPMTS